MKAPDKIVIMDGEIHRTEKTCINEVEYIRKDALLGWAKNYVKIGVSDDFSYAMDVLIRYINSL